MSVSSVEAAQGLTFTHVMGAENVLRCLIGKGSVMPSPTGADAVMNIANPMATSAADYIGGMLSANQYPTTQLISIGTSAASYGFSIYHTTTGNYSSDNGTQIGSTYMTPGSQRIMAIARKAAGVGYMKLNANVYAPAVPAAAPTTNTLNRLFRTGTIQSFAIVTRMGHWVGASLPTPAQVEAFLEG